MSSVIKWLRKRLGINELEDNTMRHLNRLGKNMSSEVKRIEQISRDLVSIDADIHECHSSNTRIVISTGLNGGQVRLVNTNFKNMRELLDFIASLQHRYNTRRLNIDATPSFKGYAEQYLRGTYE